MSTSACVHSHVIRFDDGAGHRFFWRSSSKFSDKFPNHVQQVEGFHLGESLVFLELTGNDSPCQASPVVWEVSSFVNNACCKSLHREVDVFVKLGDLLILKIILPVSTLITKLT